MIMFSRNAKKEKEEKEKARQEHIDEMLEEYDKQKNIAKLEGKKNSSFSVPKISYSKTWVGNEHADRFFKCMSPAFAIVGVGCAFWGIGFAVKEISKIAGFLKNINLPSSITDIIATKAFWEIVGVVAAVCFAVFLIATIFSVVKNKLNEAKERPIPKQHKKNMSKYMHKNHNINVNEFSCQLGENENINNYNKINKKHYNSQFNKKNRSKFHYEPNFKNKTTNIGINKTNMNKQDFYENQKRINQTFNHQKYDKNSYYEYGKLNINK